jgi:predicted N-acetyltransferase YhbS
MEINVRLEEEKDYRMVEEITRAAFGYPDRVERGQIGCPYEHWMVHELRNRDGIKALSLIAELEDGTIVGHIICSNAVVRTENLSLPVLNFGPLSVSPEYQRIGVGGALIRAMIERAKQLDYGAILFFGRPEYYPQFGFKEAEVFGIADAEGHNYPSFMAMELKTGYLKDVRGGRYFESDIYNDELNRETVRAFDREFIVRMPMII